LAFVRFASEVESRADQVGIYKVKIIMQPGGEFFQAARECLANIHLSRLHQS
jgi:hypothetical protein